MIVESSPRSSEFALKPEIEPKLRTLQAPALIVWADDDIYFDVIST